MYIYFSASIKYLPSFILYLARGKTFLLTFTNGAKLLTRPGRSYVSYRPCIKVAVFWNVTYINMSIDLQTFQRGLVFFLMLQPGSSLERPKDAFLGFLDKSLFYRVRGSSLTPDHVLMEEASLFMFPGGNVAQLHLLALGIHFSRLLRHAWTRMRLFLLAATTREFSGTYCLHFQATDFYIRSLETSRLCQ